LAPASAAASAAFESWSRVVPRWAFTDETRPTVTKAKPMVVAIITVGIAMPSWPPRSRESRV
jgi:hypothetical protein